MSTERALLHGLLDRAAARSPDRPAVTVDGITVDYAELDRASRRLGRWLSDAGLTRGQRLVICARATPLSAALIYAASRIGVVFVLLHEKVRGPQLAHVLADCEPTLVVGDTPETLEAAKNAGVPAVRGSQLAETAFSPDSPTGALPPPLSVDPVCLLYTSGTTALPKAVVSTHQQVLFAVEAIQSVLQYRSDDVVFTPVPISFDYGLYQLFLTADAGAHFWLGRSTDVGPPLLEALHRARATVLPAVPAVAQVLARLLARTQARVPGLRLLTNTGAAMPTEVLGALRSAMPDLKVQLMFGLTECKRATIMPVDGDLRRPGSSGKPLPGTEVFTVDATGARLPAFEVGEIIVRGPHVMSGYWRRAELTAARFHRAEGLFPELHTGDYGWLDQEGYLYFKGRQDDLYKENGFRVSAIEVEAAALRVPGVLATAVLTPTSDDPATLFAVTLLSSAEVLTAMRDEIEEFKIPRRCVILTRIPLTPNGKVDRKALAALPKEFLNARP